MARNSYFAASLTVGCQRPPPRCRRVRTYLANAEPLGATAHMLMPIVIRELIHQTFTNFFHHVCRQLK